MNRWHLRTAASTLALAVLCAAPLTAGPAAPAPEPSSVSLSASPGLTFPLLPGMAYFAPGYSAELGAAWPARILPPLSLRAALLYGFTPLQANAGSASQLALLGGAGWRFPLPWGLSARAYAEAGYSFGVLNGDTPLLGGWSAVARVGGGASIALGGGLSAGLDACWLWYLGSWGGLALTTGLAWELPSAPAFIPADTTGAPVHPRRLVLYVETDGNAFTREEALAASKSLAFSLSTEDPPFQVVEPGSSLFPMSAGQRAAAARSAEARGWLLVVLSGERGSPQASVTLLDLVTRKAAAERTIPLGSPAVMDAPRQDWSAVVALAGDSFPAPPPQDAGTQKARTARLGLRGAAHTAVTGLPGGPVNLGEDGFVEVELPAPASYSLRAAGAGLRPLHANIYLEDDMEAPLKQEGRSWWRLDAGIQNALFPSLDVSFFVLDGLFLQIGATSYQVGLSLSGDSIFFSYPLLETRVLAGWYPFPEDWFLRPYTAVGGFVRLVYPSGQPLQIDLAAPAGVEVSLGADFTVAERVRFYCEYAPMAYFTAYPGLLHAGTGLENSAPGYLNFRWGSISLLNARFGFRWYM
jgi:hypothetical protein